MTTDQLDLFAMAASAEHQQMLQAAAKQLIERQWSITEARSNMDDAEPLWSSGLWDAAYEAGWSDLMVPGPAGGGGAVGDLCTLSETVGASVAPLPLAASASANWYLAHPQGPEPILLVNEHPQSVDLTGGRCTLSCSWSFVPYGMVASHLLVVLEDSGHLYTATVDGNTPGMTRLPIQPLDRSPSATVELDEVVVEPVEVPTSSEFSTGSRWGDALDRFRLGIASELTGVAAAANDAAVEYARERVTFGRPIGTNQAIKHRLVNDRCNIEISRALISRAAVDLEGSTSDASAYVSLAAFWAIHTLRAVPESAVQVFGGIGYTWEHHAHLYLRKAAVLAALLGPIARHRDVVAAWLARRHSR